MADCRPRLLSLALLWFVCSLVSFSAYLISQFIFVECASAECRPCVIEGTGQNVKCRQEPEQCRFVVGVLLESDMGEKEAKQAQTACFDCDKKSAEDVQQELSENKEIQCRLSEDDDEVRIIDNRSVIITLSNISLTVAIFFALFFVFAIIRVFQSELLRLYPRFMLTAWTNLRSALSQPRSPSRASTPLGSTPEAFVTPPPAITSRRRISKLIEGSKISASEARTLREDGWSCCICLEETDDEGQTRAITRLKCNHATHSECLRIWLETGRAACCLCNADVFSEGTKEQSLSSQASTTSGGDTGFIGSLVVERTDRTPSSPATSVYIDLSQPYSDTVPSNDERDGDMESGA